MQLDTPSGSVEQEGQDLGFHGSAAVILLSDGENTAEPDPMDVAELASTAGVRVYPIGLGSPEGTVLEIDGFQVATALDEPLLREIAATTDGALLRGRRREGAWRTSTSRSTSPGPSRPSTSKITALFAAAAALLLLLGAGLSLAWFGRAV